jgi:hypothetical protein
VDCHNQHPKATVRDFKRFDVMGGLIVRLKLDARPEGMPIMSDAPPPADRKTSPQAAPAPWAPGAPLTPGEQSLKKN